MDSSLIEIHRRTHDDSCLIGCLFDTLKNAFGPSESNAWYWLSHAVSETAHPFKDRPYPPVPSWAGSTHSRTVRCKAPLISESTDTHKDDTHWHTTKERANAWSTFRTLYFQRGALEQCVWLHMIKDCPIQRCSKSRFVQCIALLVANSCRVSIPPGLTVLEKKDLAGAASWQWQWLACCAECDRSNPNCCHLLPQLVHRVECWDRSRAKR